MKENCTNRNCVAFGFSLNIDGIVLLQKVPKHSPTFGEISDYLLMKMLLTTQKLVFFVTDRYLEAVVRRCSVKKCSHKFRRIHRKTPVPETLY